MSSINFQRRVLLSILCLVSCLQLSLAQGNKSTDKDLKVNPLISNTFSYGYQFPGGDIAELFGSGFDAGLKSEYISSKNWIFGVSANILWSSNVKKDVLASLRGPEGLIATANNSANDISLRERAWRTGIQVGRLFDFSKKSRAGIRLTVGAGWMQYKVRIQEDFQINVPNLQDDYVKGYDQLTGGLALHQFIGYQHFSNNGLINFMAGVEFTQGFTSPLRTWDFATNTANEGKYLDFLTTFKLGWILPIVLEKSPENIYY